MFQKKTSFATVFGSHFGVNFCIFSLSVLTHSRRLFRSHLSYIFAPLFGTKMEPKIDYTIWAHRSYVIYGSNLSSETVLGLPGFYFLVDFEATL